MDEDEATPTIKPVEAISMLAFCSSRWSQNNAGWTTSNGFAASVSSSDASVKSVRFSTIEVREYPITIGDSLCVSKGVPHTIEWDYLQDQTLKVNVDLYERNRPNSLRRQGESLILDSWTREKRLRSMGYTTQELLDAIHAREIARRAMYC
jgi:hypothetical protein